MHTGRILSRAYAVIREMQLITMQIVNIRSISHNYAAEFLRFVIFQPQISDSCGATYRRKCNMFTALQSPLADVENRVQIHS